MADKIATDFLTKLKAKSGEAIKFKEKVIIEIIVTAIEFTIFL